MNKAREEGRPFQELLQYYAIERFLYQLSISSFADSFILKGALLLRVWYAPLSRPMMDIDMLGRTGNDPENITSMIREVLTAEDQNDGIVFNPDSVTFEAITEDADYIMTADVLIYAGRMVDRYLSSRWKMFFDRIFFNTHTPVLVGKQVAFVISGPFSQVPNMMEIFSGFFGFQGANIVGVVSDESGNSADLDRLRIIFAADHRAFRRMGVYKTFPPAELNTALLNTFVAPFVNLPPIRKKFDKMIKKQMVEQHKMVVAKARAHEK